MEQSGLVEPRDHLHRQSVQEGSEAHVCPGCQDPRPVPPLQLQFGGHHAQGESTSKGETVDARAFKTLVKAAVAQNHVMPKKR